MKDTRYAEDVTTHDYGANLFARVDLFRGLFVQGEYEYLNYEYARNHQGDTSRDTQGSWLAGPGISFGGRGVGFYMVGLYNFSYDSNDLYSPYDEPWIFRAGVTFSF